MSKKSETKKQPEKKTAKATPAQKAKATPAQTKAKKPTEAKPKNATQPAGPAHEAPAALNITPAATPATKPAPIAPQAPDARLPAPGTLLQKRDRHGAVRCECTVETLCGAPEYADRPASVCGRMAG